MGWQGPRAEWLWALPSIGLQSILYKLVDTPLDRGTIVKANSTIYVCDIKYFSKNDSNGYVYIIASITDRPGQDVVTRGKARLIHCGRCLHGISGSLTSQDTDWMDQSYRVNRRGCWEERREYQHRSGPQELWAPQEQAWTIPELFVALFSTARALTNNSFQEKETSLQGREILLYF